MKTLVFGLLIVFAPHSFAQTIVHGSIYMALGAATPNYFNQIKQTTQAVSNSGYPKMEEFKLSQLQFTNAIVNGNSIRYKYILINSDRNRDHYGPVCTLEVEMDIDSNKAQLIDVRAQYNCKEWDD